MGGNIATVVDSVADTKQDDSEALQDKVRYFDETFMPYYNRILAYAYSMIYNLEDAKEVVQETFLRAFNSYESRYKHNTYAKRWLLTIAHNLCIDLLRKSGREVATDPIEILKQFRRLPIRTSPEFTALDILCNPGVLVEFEEYIFDGLHPYLATIEAKFRIPVYLNAFFGVKAREIAEWTGNIPIRTVLTRIYQGKRKIREALQGADVTRSNDISQYRFS